MQITKSLKYIYGGLWHLSVFTLPILGFVWSLNQKFDLTTWQSWVALINLTLLGLSSILLSSYLIRKVFNKNE